MADIPDQSIFGGLEHVVQRDGQLNHAKPGAQMPAGDRHGIDGFAAQLIGQLLELVGGKIAHIGRDPDGIE